MDDKTKLALGIIALDTGLNLINESLGDRALIDIDSEMAATLCRWLRKPSSIDKVAALYMLLWEIDSEINKL